MQSKMAWEGGSGGFHLAGWGWRFGHGSKPMVPSWDRVNSLRILEAILVAGLGCSLGANRFGF